ncbi:chloride channel protein [Leptospira wolffii]|uniref:chloride channel protein n=1 Tax=Leptospira wolffii TaxID=409998 RepID=UPI00034B243B|nr:chloride channel protein [Leptospira wolffii]TGK55234.1 chloride channel protein [Leptospira wolffii]TGK65743.1 chloride channel protein [Leptospira wolffii]TGK70465.1 chloride channel protein [Leptospira wolffii]TGL29999.1 chloride channel protein [Leptospira wolffii]
MDRVLAFFKNPAFVLSRKNPFMLSRWSILYVLLGIFAGLFSALFWKCLEFLTRLLSGFEGHYVILIMTFAGLLIGLLIHVLGEPGEISLVIDNIRFRGGKLDPKNNPSMALSSLLSISAGGSAGPEAPLVQVTGSIGSWFAEKLGLEGEELRSMTIAGMAAGFTSLFGSPLGGALFALEILQHRHVVEYYEALLPAFLSSCSAYFVFLFMTDIGIGPTWQFPQYVPGGIEDFQYAIVFGIAGALVGWVFYGVFQITKFSFSKIVAPIFVKTTIGGLLLGLIAFYEPLTRYFSHDQLNEIVVTKGTWVFFGTLALLKILSINITVSSGWRGGIIIPLFFLGAVSGRFLMDFFPTENESFLLICLMASVNASVTKTPISTTILLAGLTGVSNFTPVLFASLSGYFLSPKAPFIRSQADSV